ncbi:MAG: hypothetical protein K0S96_1163, partial [Geminicoccaceae bacterium]|nr:hypothetical protein [Geminicoccaceae bacterium]
MNIDPSPMSVNTAAVTVLEIQDSNRANKLVRRLPDGSIEKLGGDESGIYRAQQVAVPDVATMAEVPGELAED